MNKYVFELPLLVRDLIKAFSDESRQKILIYLKKKGTKSFIEISKELEIPKNNLSHHIKTLMRYGLIYNFYRRNKFADKYSFYEISKLGKKIITSLSNLISPISYELELPSYKIIKPFMDSEESPNVMRVIETTKSSYPKAKTPLTVITAETGIIGGDIRYEWHSIKKEELYINAAW